MSMPAAPSQVLSSRLPGTPAQVWARVQHSAFIASYLGAHLPAADLADLPAGQRLAGTARDGRPLALQVTEALAPCSLSLQLHSGGAASRLSLSIAECGQGSRLTVLHEDDTRAALPIDGLAQQLAQPLAAALQAGSLTHPDAQGAAQAYLADTARLVDRLRHALPPRQGYAQPAGGGFSLAQHLWHLADVEQFGWAQRFERLLVEPHPVLPGVDGDRLALERRYQQRPWRGAAARFIGQRRRTLAALARCDAATLRRPVVFSGQRATGAEMLAALLAHDHEHRVEMAALWPPPNAPDLGPDVEPDEPPTGALR